MPLRSPFTRLCQQTAQAQRGLADLHVHSTQSDGELTPAEIVAFARQEKLAAIAITDHDTFDALPEARRAALGIEVISGVEITAEFEGRELHLLGYFFDPEHPDLLAALEELRERRRERFGLMVDQLHRSGVSVCVDAFHALQNGPRALGRRHLAHLLVKSQQAGSVHEAFSRYLARPEIMEVPKRRLPVARAITLVHDAGGVASWAHPPSTAGVDALRELQALGLDAVETEYPWAKPAHGRRLRGLAKQLGLAITVGSDCHGPQPRQRRIGAKGIDRAELEALRRPRG